MDKKALVLVDIQNDFCPGGALEVPKGDEVVEVANSMQAYFSQVVATQDWHPADHGSFAANHEAKQPGDVIDLHGITQVLWPMHCVQGSRGAEFVESLSTGRIRKVFRKGQDVRVDSYSGFYDNGKTNPSGLSHYLRNLGVAELYILGLATDYCVKYTALDAVAEGFDCYVIEDGCRGVELAPGDVDAAIDEMRQAGVTIIHSGQIGSYS